MTGTASAASTIVGAADWNDNAFRQRFEQLYEQLRILARRELSGKPRATLCTTLLVHEAYLKLDGGRFDVSERGRFLALAAKAMRCVLVDHVRATMAQKRGGDLARITLATDLSAAADNDDRIDLIAVEQGLDALQRIEPRLVTVVECRFYAGMEFQEIAAHLGVAERTVHRDWRKARAFLLSHFGDVA